MKVCVIVALLLGLALRWHGIHNPLLDHPGWRQGDTASIARNFARLQFNPLYPQTDYNGPPPNYVELELQIVPFLAAAVYKIAGIHEIAGRLISIAFSLGTIALLAYFARWLFASGMAGAAAALAFAIMPGSVYYGRTFMPDTAMVFFFTAATFAMARYFIESERWTIGATAGVTALVSLALLAKPVAIVLYAPLLVLALERIFAGRTIRWFMLTCVVLVPLAILYAYDREVASHAKWMWASGITTKHILPALGASFRSAAALHAKLINFRLMLQLFSVAMAGPALAVLGLLGLVVLALPRNAALAIRSRSFLWAWLIGGLAYIYVVVTVERVDYYMYLLLPLVALLAGLFAERISAAITAAGFGSAWRYAMAVLGVIAVAGITLQNRAIAAPYYRYSKAVYRNAIFLDRVLQPDALVVMAHYDPSILYYIGRFGWEEDPYIWTPFDEQSAIAKGARYFIAIERNRFYRNVELCAWMQRFPVLNAHAQWPVYVTDPAKVKADAEKQWRSFREAEKAGKAREWLDARGLCKT